MSDFEEWYSKNGTFNNIIDEAVWTDMEKLFTFWQKTEKENARLRELIRLAMAGFEVVENKHEEIFSYWLSEARKALEKSE